ncbi:Vitamin B12 import system permease protein BtuC [uncultured Clostridium sp.]|nr:iron ABC transporter permease [Clostridium sp. AM30-24]RHT44579.1 iron ABC transporter permease [Clostridium sp. AM30-24]SCH82887.1 Vitamin B12 import system permease protein BtuC [uncultured Clostridium sp.]
MVSQTKRIIRVYLMLLVLLAVMSFLSLAVGSVRVSAADILAVLEGKTENDMIRHILFDIRLPRMLAALILGGALSVSGFLLQTFFSNPIAGPFVLGISSGAKLVVSVFMILFLGQGLIMNSWGMVLAAFLGAMASMGFVLAISKKLPQMSMLVVSGIMIGYICSAATDFIVTFADDSNIVNLHNWSMGSFSGISMDGVKICALVVAAAFLSSMLLSKAMGAYQLGEVYARNMGVNIRQFRIELILLSSILSATVTAFAGPVSFVGIAVPHVIKQLFKTAKPIVVIPGCFLGGASFCLFSDLLARTLFSPTELSISSVTAVFGAPVVIAMMIKRAEH